MSPRGDAQSRAAASERLGLRTGDRMQAYDFKVPGPLPGSLAQVGSAGEPGIVVEEMAPRPYAPGLPVALRSTGATSNDPLRFRPSPPQSVPG